jgi:cephalosporin-C deacetylase-like acetyl esterase
MLLRSLVFLLALSSSLAAYGAKTLSVTPDVATGVYMPGSKVTWKIKLLEDGEPRAAKVSYTVQKGGLTKIDEGTLDLTTDGATVSATRNEPGVLLLMVKYKVEGEKELNAMGGAAYAPEKIAASAPPPDDFDAFWKAKIAELDAVPMNVKLEPIDIGDKNVEYFKVTMDNIRGRKIYGQLAKPAGKKELPALLQVQWAGVYPLQRDWVVGYAKSGWLSLNISAHDLPIDEKQEFYNAKSAKELADYPGQGNDDRETSYFLPMFLSCRRAVDYLAEHPDWNKKTLIVHGGSQGGYQAIVTAGLHPAVTAFAANVPAGCDHTGKSVGRSPGWPNWASRTWQKKDEQKMLTAARYFDAMNFATRAKCPGLIGVGLVDITCPAEGVLATCNQLQGEKEIVLMPQADHGGDHKAYYQAFGPWLEKQKK